MAFMVRGRPLIPNTSRFTRGGIFVLLASAGVFSVPWTGFAGDSLQSIAQREIARRQQIVANADAQLAEADLLRSKGDHQGAAKVLLEAYQGLPKAPVAADARARVLAAYAEASCARAQELLKQGRQKEALEVLDAVLEDDLDPHNEAVLKLKRHAADPDRYPPALTPEHIAKVDKVKSLLTLAGSATDLGDYDKALGYYNEVLQNDKFNITARREMERVEQLRAQYFDSARDQTRAHLMNEVSSQWEKSVPPSVDLTNMFTAGGGGTSPLGNRQKIERKLRELHLPRVEFAGATLDEIMEYLRVSSRNVDPEGKGVSFVVNVDDATKSRTLALSLQNMPIEELLRYITQMSGTAYRVDDNAVIIGSLSEKSTNLVSQKFRVPPDFIQKAEVSNAAPSDPFAQPAAGQPSQLMKRMGAKEFLESRGVTFPEGAGASFSPSTSTLIVRTTADSMDLVQMLVDQSLGNVTKQAKIAVRMVEINEEAFRELGFDVGVGQANLPGSNRIFASGGTNDVNKGPLPMMSNGLRGSGEIVGAPGIDELLRQAGDIQSGTSSSSSQFRLAGVFTDPQIDITLRNLQNTKGVDLATVPSIVTKSGQKAAIRVVREFPYPTEFDPPQIPQQVNSSSSGVALLGPNGVAISGQSTSSSGAPVVPSTPTAFEKKELGIVLEVEPNISGDGRTVELALSPNVTEFEGFIDYGEDITNTNGTIVQTLLNGVLSTTSPPSYVQKNDILQPVFKRTSTTTTVNVYDGSTIVFAGLLDERTTDVQDKVPVVGDIPLIGRLWQSKVKQVRKKAILFYVTVDVIDPAGQKVNQPAPVTAQAP